MTHAHTRMMLESQLLIRLFDVLSAGGDLDTKGFIGVHVGRRLSREVIYFEGHGDW